MHPVSLVLFGGTREPPSPKKCTGRGHQDSEAMAFGGSGFLSHHGVCGCFLICLGSLFETASLALLVPPHGAERVLDPVSLIHPC